MKTLIIYDSLFGNTEKVAKAIGSGIKEEVDIKVVGDVDSKELEFYDLIIVGSPTHGGQASKNLQAFFKSLAKDSLKGKKVASFDTRFAMDGHGKPMKFLMKTIGFAASKILRTLEKKGGNPVGKAEGYIVEGKEGPLKKGELERAKEWGGKVSST